jgi:hypothetical protein
MGLSEYVVIPTRKDFNMIYPFTSASSTKAVAEEVRSGAFADTNLRGNAQRRLNPDLLARPLNDTGAGSQSTFVSDAQGSAFALMMEYQKMINKEARQDQKTASADAQSKLMSKESQLDRVNTEIDKAMKEASEGLDRAMSAVGDFTSAVTQLNISAGTPVNVSSRYAYILLSRSLR